MLCSCLLDGGERMCCRRVACDDERFRTLFEEVGSDRKRIPNHGDWSARAIGYTRSIAQIEIVMLWEFIPKCPEHCQATDARVEDAYSQRNLHCH